MRSKTERLMILASFGAFYDVLDYVCDHVDPGFAEEFRSLARVAARLEGRLRAARVEEREGATPPYSFSQGTVPYQIPGERFMHVDLETGELDLPGEVDDGD